MHGSQPGDHLVYTIYFKVQGGNCLSCFSYKRSKLWLVLANVQCREPFQLALYRTNIGSPSRTAQRTTYWFHMASLVRTVCPSVKWGQRCTNFHYMDNILCPSSNKTVIYLLLLNITSHLSLSFFSTAPSVLTRGWPTQADPLSAHWSQPQCSKTRPTLGNIWFPHTPTGYVAFLFSSRDKNTRVCGLVLRRIGAWISLAEPSWENIQDGCAQDWEAGRGSGHRFQRICGICFRL